MKRLIIWLLFLLTTGNSFAQDYIEYQRTFNRIDEDLLSQNYHLTIKRLDSIYSNYPFIYAKHCIKALQICITANDSANAAKWLAKCPQQGVPLWYIRNNELTKQSLKYSTTNTTRREYDSLYAVYKAGIDARLAKTIDSLLVIDQHFTRKVNYGFALFRLIYWIQWGNNNKRQLVTLKQIIESKGYPGERVLGLDGFIEDSSRSSQYLTFYGPHEFREASVQIMLQHCFSTRHKVDTSFKNTLFKNLRNGHMPAFQFAIVNDFMCNRKKKYIKDRYDINEKGPDKAYVSKVNRNRNTIGLNTYEQEERNTLIERERRKSKKTNSEIMLE